MKLSEVRQEEVPGSRVALGYRLAVGDATGVHQFIFSPLLFPNAGFVRTSRLKMMN